MTLISPAHSSLKITLQEHLNYDDGTETQYEWVNGELLVMPPDSEFNHG